MPNTCWNYITIACKNVEHKDEIKNIHDNELCKEAENEGLLKIQEKGAQGIRVLYETGWNPDFDWMESLVEKYKNCWFKDEWHEAGGGAGVWIGYHERNEKIIEQFSWDDLSLEEKHYLFVE